MKTCKSYERAGKGSNSRTAGSGDTLDTLLRSHEGEARQFAYELAGDSEEAKELVQAASYRVLRYWESYDPVRSFQSWYLTIVKNLFKDTRRRASRERMLSLDAPLNMDGSLSLGDTLGDGQVGIPEQMERREGVTAVRRTLKSLKKDYLAVVTLCDIEGMRYQDAARKLGLNVGTVRSRLCRARAALRRNVELAQII
ncbi:MAG: RNA polymerase sigma factor [Elusimicrobia bacterium]|nr:RNA polymerase sigma factor [Elusimicrobiota bacterium]